MGKRILERRRDENLDWGGSNLVQVFSSFGVDSGKFPPILNLRWSLENSITPAKIQAQLKKVGIEDVCDMHV